MTKVNKQNRDELPGQDRDGEKKYIPELERLGCSGKWRSVKFEWLKGWPPQSTTYRVTPKDQISIGKERR